MKKFLKQFGKVICYYVFFWGMQIVMYVAFSFIYGVKAGLEMAAGSENAGIEAITLGAESFLMQNMYIIMILSGCLTLLVLWIFFRVRKKKMSDEIGFRPLSAKYALLIFILGITLAAAVSFALGLLPEDILEAYNQQSGQLLGDFGIDSIIAVMIMAPLVEEVIFRGLILSRLRKALPLVWAVILSSLIFGISHGQIVWIAYAFVLGIVLSVVVTKTESLVASILLHISFNIFGTVIPTVCSEITSMAVCPVIALISAVVSVLLLIMIVREKQPLEGNAVLQ